MSHEADPLYELWQLVAGQFHQDWSSEYEDEWEAGEDFVRTSSESVLVAVAASIGNLFNLVAVQSERLNRYPQIVGVFIEGEFDAWLLAVQRRIEQRLAGTTASPWWHQADPGRGVSSVVPEGEWCQKANGHGAGRVLDLEGRVHGGMRRETACTTKTIRCGSLIS